jgi:acetyl-CoA acyltransferase
MTDAFICTGLRTPIGRYGGGLSSVRPDDLLAHVIRELMAKTGLPSDAIDDVIMGCANQAGEDNRNVARMATLLAGIDPMVPGATINRLCGSGLDAVGTAARAIKAGEAHVMLAGGVESMSRAPFVMGKADSAFSRNAQIFDTTIGWRFVNKLMKAQYGVDSMPETAENVAEDWGISREAQDAFAYRSQLKAAAAQANGRLAQEIAPISIPQRKGDPVVISADEHPRATTMEKLAALKTPFRAGGSVTAGNASGVNDGAAAMIIASGAAVEKYGLTPLARIVGMATAGVAPRVMGFGPAPATRKLLERTGFGIGDIDVIELNEAFAAQGLAVTRDLGLPDDAEHVNPNGGAIALSAAIELQNRGAKRAICTMCIGVGQGIALMIERA